MVWNIFSPSNEPLYDPGANWCPDCGEIRVVCTCNERDQCPLCHSRNTERIGTILPDPVIWFCECGACGEVFERGQS